MKHKHTIMISTHRISDKQSFMYRYILYIKIFNSIVYNFIKIIYRILLNHMQKIVIKCLTMFFNISNKFVDK